MRTLTAFQIGLFGTIILLAIATLTQGCAVAVADTNDCRSVPAQPIYANVPSWAYYECAPDAVPNDDAQCARLQQSTSDPSHPVTWACDRPDTGPVLLAALSESGGKGATLSVPTSTCAEFSGALTAYGEPRDGVTIWRGPIILEITSARQTYATAAENCITLAPGEGSW